MATKSQITEDDVYEAEQKLEKMLEAMSNLTDFFRRVGGITNQRFEAYPKGHITMALNNDHGYMGKEMFTIEGLIEEAQEAAEDVDDEDEDEEDQAQVVA